MSTSSNKDNSKSENSSDSDYEMSKDDSNERSSDQTSNDNQFKEEEKKKEKEKNQLADKIKKENDIVMHNSEQSRADRLKFLLNQTKTYTNFLMGAKIEDHDAKIKKVNSKRKRKNSEVEGNVEDIKILQQKNNIDENDLKAESKQLTRLYYQPSSLTGGKLTDYQLDGLNWLISLYERGLNGILADEMGLGKTIQSIALMAYLKQFKKKYGYFLVIVPKSTMPNWARECKLWIPTLNCIILNPVKEEREETLKLIAKHKFEVVITSYEGVNICINKLKKIKWELLIIDEAHRIKNENALLSKNVRLLESKFRILVTGTPLQNNLHELWALLNFLLPDIFSSSSDFDEVFGMGGDKEGEGEENKEKVEEDIEERNAEIVQQLHRILKPFLLRRTKAEVERSLPPKKEIHIKVGLTELQKRLYKKLLTSSLLQESKTVYKNIIMQLRKVCNHPYLFDGVEEQHPPENHLVIYSSKMRILNKLCQKLYGKSQILIFSQMTRMLDILEDYCNEKGYKYCRIDGETSLEDREIMITEFTKPNSDKFIFLLSTRAGGLGLNLMSSDTVILYDSDWNPQVDLQAMDRVHRIGQTKPVLIYRLLCENTIEEKILERQAMRLKLDSLVIQQGRVLKVGEHFTKDQMKEMIQYGADAIFRAGDDFKDEEIDLILKRGEEQTNKFFEEAEKQAKSKSNLLLNFSFDPNDLYKFENEDYRLKRKANAEKALSAAYALELEKENKLMNSRRDHGHVNYNVDQQQAQLFGNKNQKKKNKTPKIPIYHLYKNRDRIIELKQKQINYFIENSKKLPEKIDEDPNISEGLTKEEYEELKNLLSTGFPNWEKKEYEIFINALEYIPKDDIERLAKEIPTKTSEEIKEYCENFWARIEEFSDGQRIIKNIEKKEKLEKQKQQSSMLIAKKCKDIEDGEYEDIKIAFPTNNHQSEYTYEEDQYLIYITNKYGYGNWDDIMKSIKTSEDLLFNYFLKSRNKIEIQKRIDYLVKIIEKELGSTLNVNNNERTSNRKNKENKEKNEEDNNSFMLSNMSKVSSSNKKGKKKDETNSINNRDDSKKENNINNININLNEDEDENEEEKDKNNEDDENIKQNTNIYKKKKNDENQNENIINIENNEEINSNDGVVV